MVINLFVFLEVKTYISLRSLLTQKIIAEGFIHSINSTTRVGRQMFGLNWCEICVIAVIEPKEQLIRPYDNFQELSQILGHIIAWLIALYILFITYN